MNNYYLVGADIQNSLSPFIHNYVFNKIKINANYMLYEVKKSSDCLDLLNKSFDKNIAGINITTPFKKELIMHIDHIDDEAQKINAINCISFNNNTLVGYNTDWIGFIKMIKNNNIIVNDKEVHIIGEGGSFKAIYFALKSLGCTNFKFYNRKNVEKLNIDKSKTNSIVVNCTPKHFLEDSVKFRDKFINGNYLWIDLLYTKLSTKNTQLINNSEKLYINGIDMLIYQALESINIWFRKDVCRNVDLYDLKQQIKGL